MSKLTFIKKQFPIFDRYPELVYLDSASTSQKPRAVIDRIKHYYEDENANVHRGIYTLSEQATSAYEAVREKVAGFINAPHQEEVIFTHGATEAINVVAHGLSLKDDEEIILTEMEHHANIVPWQIKIKDTGQSTEALGRLKYIPITSEGKLDLEALPHLITPHTKIVALTYVSNVLGTINPVKEIIQKIKALHPGCLVLVDGAQALPHMSVDVQDIGCDFFVFSGHKLCGPTGIGVLWGKTDCLERIAPLIYGGSMISRVEKNKTSFADIPYKFEAGTPHIAGVVGLGAAIDFLEECGMDHIVDHCRQLTEYGLEKLSAQPHSTLYGPHTTHDRLPIFSFAIQCIHAHDVAQVLDEHHIAVRAGHHCAMPLHDVLGATATVRASFYLYNNEEDVDRLVDGIEKVKRAFK